MYHLADINFSILAIYSFCFMFNRCASRAYALLAFFICCLLSYTEIYNNINAVQYHAFFAIIYIAATYKIERVSTKVACCLLACFQITMAWDSWINAENTTYIWLHYEVIIYMLHAIIICSFLSVDAAKIKRGVANVFASLLDMLGNTCNMPCLCYYYSHKRITKEHS